jgi:hypothetical protein
MGVMSVIFSFFENEGKIFVSIDSKVRRGKQESETLIASDTNPLP